MTRGNILHSFVDDQGTSCLLLEFSYNKVATFGIYYRN